MANKSDNNSKSQIFQWVILVAVLLIFVVYSLVSFYITMLERSRNNTLEHISKQAISIAGYYNGLINSYTDLSQALADSFVGSNDLFDKKNVKLISEIKKGMDLENVFIIDSETHNAIDADGNTIFAEDIDASNGLSSVIVSEKSKSFDYYGNEGAALYISAPIRTEKEWWGNVVFEYIPKKADNIITSGAYSYSFIFSNGMVAEMVGAENPLFSVGDNIENVFNNNTFVEGNKSSFKQNVESGNSGLLVVEHANGRKQYLKYQPVGNLGACVVVSVMETQINKSVDNENRPTTNLILEILIAFAIFLALVFTMYLINKVGYAKQSKELQNKAETDLLTELYNKVSTEKKIQEYLDGEGKDKINMMCVLDIDNFKKINDTMGHAFGDEVIASLGKQIKSEFRVTDILGRIGGDEFVIFLKDLKTDEVIEREAERISLFFKDFTVGTYTKYSPTASIGAAIYPRDAHDYESLYKAGDTALYKAKKRGKNQLAFYKDATDVVKPEEENATK